MSKTKKRVASLSRQGEPRKRCAICRRKVYESAMTAYPKEPIEGQQQFSVCDYRECHVTAVKDLGNHEVSQLCNTIPINKDHADGLLKRIRELIQREFYSLNDRQKVLLFTRGMFLLKTILKK